MNYELETKEINERIIDLKKAIKECKTRQEKDNLKRELHNKIIDAKVSDIKKADLFSTKLPKVLKWLYDLGRNTTMMTKPKYK